MNELRIEADHWWGASRYPLSEDGRQALYEIVNKRLLELVGDVTKLMSDRCGHPLMAEVFTLTMVGDGWNASVDGGDPNWWQTDAMRSASETERIDGVQPRDTRNDAFRDSDAKP